MHVEKLKNGITHSHGRSKWQYGFFHQLSSHHPSAIGAIKILHIPIATFPFELTMHSRYELVMYLDIGLLPSSKTDFATFDIELRPLHRATYHFDEGIAEIA
jgi:hypothetical protein